MPKTKKDEAVLRMADELEYMDYATVCELVEEFDWEECDFEALRERRWAENDCFLDEFEADLIAAGLSQATVDAHMSNVGFYLNSYLQHEVPLEMRAGIYFIDRFLGNYFIRKCMWSTPKTVKSNITSLKKFYKSMLQRGHIRQDDYGYFVELVKRNKDHWCDLCAQFNDPEMSSPFHPIGFDMDYVPERKPDIPSSTDDIIIDLLYDMGMGIERDEFEKRALNCAGEVDILDNLIEERDLRLYDDQVDTALEALSEFWHRWTPNIPNWMGFINCAVCGYDEADSGNLANALDEWSQAWNALKRVSSFWGADLLVSDMQYLPERTIGDWLADYENLLTHPAAQNESLASTHANFIAELNKLLEQAKMEQKRGLFLRSR